jgi:hypothetical protein
MFDVKEIPRGKLFIPEECGRREEQEELALALR